MTKALLVAHPNVEKSTTSGDNIVPKDPGGGLRAATPITNLPMNERRLPMGVMTFLRLLTEIIVTRMTSQMWGRSG